MNRSIFRMSLDIHEVSSQAYLTVKKRDDTRRLVITLTENGVPYHIADGCYAVFTARKADSTYLYNACSIEDNKIVYDFGEQTAAAEGNAECEIVLYGADGGRITSPRFTIYVDPTVYNGETVEDSESSSQMNALDDLVTRGNRVITGATTLIKNVEDKVANGEFNGEKGEQGDSGVYMGEEEPTDESVKVWIKTDGDSDGEDFVLKPDQIAALDSLFQLVAYTANATAEYAAFKKAFGVADTGDDETPDTPDTPYTPDEPDEPDTPDTPDTPEVGDELVTDGLLAYFDFRTASYNNAGSGGSTTIAATQGDGQLFAWANNGVEVQDEYGIHFANTRNNMYSQTGNTTATDIGKSMTLVMLTYGHVMAQGFAYATTGAKWAFKPQYNNASGSTAYATQKSGNDYNADACDDYNFCVYRVDGDILTEIMDTSVATYNGGDIDGFASWQTTVAAQIQNASVDGYYCTAMAIYNRALTDVEIEEVRAFMETLEVA